MTSRNFGQFLISLPLLSHFLVLRLQYCHNKFLNPNPLRPWRHMDGPEERNPFFNNQEVRWSIFKSSCLRKLVHWTRHLAAVVYPTTCWTRPRIMSAQLLWVTRSLRPTPATTTSALTSPSLRMANSSLAMRAMYFQATPCPLTPTDNKV